MPNSVTRRQLLIGGAMLTPLAIAQPAFAQSSHVSAPTPAEAPVGTLPFLHGVASGDPLPHSVVLWTRVTPGAEAQPGSGLGPDTTLAWEVARDAKFQDVVKRGECLATAARDHTVHVDPWGLAADSVYYFRFLVLDGEFSGHVSPTGRTRTAPAFEASPEQLNIAVASCANWESGFFSAYRDIAHRAFEGELDLVVFLGDYIYEHATGEYTGKRGAFRIHEPTWELTTLQDYRRRYGRYRTDPELQVAHGALPWVAIWDDHESANNSWRDGAQNHSPREGEWHTRKTAAMQAHLEWLPIRAENSSRQVSLYRGFRFGNLLELNMLDLRSYRDQQATYLPPDQGLRTFNDGSRSIMGSEQFEWLRRRISTSDTSWNVIGSSVMFAPMNLLTLQDNPRTKVIADFLGTRITGVPFNPDQWDGYAAERHRLTALLAKKDTPLLALSGDVHTEWANALSHEGREIGVEMVCASVSAPNVDENLKLPADNPLSHLAEQLLRETNPHVRHVDLDSHGYSIARIRRDEVELRWLRVTDVERQGAPVHEHLRKTWRKGVGFIS
ncbi:Phospholipase D precursor [Corynebacterium occultum]|uniref:Phospholipase D n=1 Tax=Corynebacterium occultum TaxID=2675219 RepID=A0A6B8WAN6_9CORY|nr:alkaline phosphatase D family protein [Corynebacterium occultum]QGU07906.1 Phospholipase D precursor [Corynebacterium occultum]